MRIPARTPLTRWLLAIVIATAGLALHAAPARAEAGAKVTVITRNLYLGGDLTPSIVAPTLPAFLAANAALLAHVDLVDFPQRAKLIAAEIAEREPDLVGLQEAALWRTGPMFDPAAATQVRYDYLALVLAELDRLGEHYDVAVSQDEADLEAPAGAPFMLDVRLTMRDAILVRHGQRVKITATASGHYATNLVFPLAATGGSATSTRGWTEVDAVHGTRPFRFVNTHLEAYSALVRLAQARELLAGPLAVPGDVVLVGDLNSGPDLPVPDNRLAYLALVGGGMVDSWPILHPGDPGYTAGLGDDLTQPAWDVENRIDMVMFRGAVVPVSSGLFGTERQTPDGRWASDHLGHVATLALSP
jgi:endonuclease/exonuclease/phosphatase family metal-dependent hydrolase